MQFHVFLGVSASSYTYVKATSLNPSHVPPSSAVCYNEIAQPYTDLHLVVEAERGLLPTCRWYSFRRRGNLAWATAKLLNPLCCLIIYH
jgi:hypothetical protein